MNQYPLWRYLLIIFVIGMGAIYALPNIYGNDPAFQVSALRGDPIDEALRERISRALAEADITPKRMELGENRRHLSLERRNDTVQLFLALPQDLDVTVVQRARPGIVRAASDEAGDAPGSVRVEKGEHDSLDLEIAGRKRPRLQDPRPIAQCVDDFRRRTTHFATAWPSSQR